MAATKAALTTEQKLEMGTKACGLIADGASVSAACSEVGTSWQRLWEWKAEIPQLADMYAHAREMRAELDVERAQRIADGTDALGDLADELAEIEADSMDAEKRSAFMAAFSSNRIQRDRIRVDLAKWVAARRAPKDYGDKVDVTTAGKALSGVIALPAETWGASDHQTVTE